MSAGDIDNFGLYLHVPYCKSLCHYCDFAKTANFTDDHGRRYLGRLKGELEAWLETLKSARMATPFTSVFFGGGTPSLFSTEYADLFALIRSVTSIDAEITLESNPDDITPERLQVWRDLGVNRLSIGVQTFRPQGLKYLKRAHDADAARAAIKAAQSVFAKVNADLIYGWGGQSLADWRADLEEVLALGVSHLSLYTLTYEGRTPLARAASRGLVTPEADEHLEAMFMAACERLAAAGFIHEEVSNWARPGHACQHNWGYWQDQPFLGVGVGAHGYLRTASGPGLRYAYGRDDRAFLRRASASTLANATMAPVHLTERFGIELEADRTSATWLTDYVGAGLRTKRGLDLDKIARETGATLRPTPVLEEGLARGIITIEIKAEGGGQTLHLDPCEWFRETAWGVEVLLSLDP